MGYEAMTKAEKDNVHDVGVKLTHVAEYARRMEANPYNNAAKEKHVRAIFGELAKLVEEANDMLLLAFKTDKGKN
jgi:hypothetical protein